ncbi:rhomboid family intramembrane serine protease [Chitinophaga sp. SYP-B3965]|uniref:rhomboid family intramembrane serine protease n=1 Tax=Chitinophaga sp. SYP-B3965 TaxID=2663120 RepID=UPI001299B1B8|nr:rhomboid family intramembrane serine protease [Chitinophaga sp. SYP-B3965]MRG46387.1 rhomboid family intramembrane serine protease [Chitinophaga sp. SYP-B3965]
MQVAEKERMPRLSLGEEKNMVTQLLLLNITVYILLLFIQVIYRMEDYGIPAFNRDILANTMLPADPMTLLTKPWTIITAMFAHLQFWDIFSNMVWLFVFGTILQNVSSHHRLVIPLYIFGSFCGMAFYVTGMNLIPAFRPLVPTSSLMGAGAGVMALAVGATVLTPKGRVFPLLMQGGVPVWVITLIFFALHGTAVFAGGGSLTVLLYLLGGGFMGYMFMAQFKKGHNWGTWINDIFFNVGHIFHPKEKKEALKAEITTSRSGFRATPVPFTKVGHVPEHKINEILDKINAHGIDTLTAEEKETLLRASKEKEGEV